MFLLFIFSLDLTKTSAVESAITIQTAAEQHLSQLIPELCKSDLEVAELERQLKEFMLNKKAKVNGNSNNVNQASEIEKEESNEGKQISEKLSPSITESSDDIYQESRSFKDHSTATVCVL